MQVDSKISEIGAKTKKIVDKIYVIALFLFLASYACKLTYYAASFFNVLYLVGTSILALISIYRLFFIYTSGRKKVILPFSVILLGLLIVLVSGDNNVVLTAVIAVAGMGVSADQILLAGISGNVVMIINNIVMSFVREPGIFTVDNQDRHFLLLGKNTFYVSKMNNASSTDFAAHYFWMFAAYLWVRGKKISWGEIFALWGLNILVYALTASKTALFCISLLLLCSLAMKVILIFRKKSENKQKSDTASGNASVLSNAGKIISKVFVFCCRYSYVIFAGICVLLAILFSCSSPLLLKLNESLHWRLSLGHRGITEYGIHLIASDVPVYGMSSSFDGFYNFLDCSYVSILLRNGILALLFYLVSMSAIQIKHKKYIYGVVILAVCALSCVEEHHLPELPYNMFMLLLFADYGADKIQDNPSISVKKTTEKLISITAYLLCGVFCISAAVVYYPRYKSVKELDRLDSKAGLIYNAVQNNLNVLSENDFWQQKTSSMSSDQYGTVLKSPDDFSRVTGLDWNDAIDDPKEHAYYSVYYDSGKSGSADPVIELMINDEVKELIGEGSAIIEYDVISGKVYSVWYSEMKGCYVIENGRWDDRDGRLRSDVLIKEGYSTGVVNG